MDFYSYDVFSLHKYVNNQQCLNMSGKQSIVREKLEVKIIPDEYIEDIDKIKTFNEKKYLYCIYQLELITKGKRFIYIGSTKNPKVRYKTHIDSLKLNKHHNKELQLAYNDYKDSEIKYKFSIIDGTFNKNELLQKEHSWVIKVASRYHNKYDKHGRELLVVHSS